MIIAMLVKNKTIVQFKLQQIMSSL